MALQALNLEIKGNYLPVHHTEVRDREKGGYKFVGKIATKDAEWIDKEEDPGYMVKLRDRLDNKLYSLIYLRYEDYEKFLLFGKDDVEVCVWFGDFDHYCTLIETVAYMKKIGLF